MIPPPLCRGAETLDREAFRTSLDLLGLRVLPQQVGAVTKGFPDSLLNQPRLRNVVDADRQPPTKDATTPLAPKASHKIVLLDRAIRAPEDLPTELHVWAQANNATTVPYQLPLTYDYWTADDILSAILPEDLPAPTSYESVGHIAHMNLRDEYLPYRHLIGQVILDKSATIRTVVNKLDSIDTTFRFFKMEVLAGPDDMLAEVRESECRFQFDFSKVYWNSRLHHEHERVVKTFQPGQFVCDVFAGVGPFALPAAKRGCYVYANDLNPESFKWLQSNIHNNKLDGQVLSYNMDGREFIRQSFKDLHANGTRNVKPYVRPALRNKRARRTANATTEGEDKPADDLTAEVASSADPSPTSTSPATFQHVVMNLPATAIEFLDAFKGVMNGLAEDDTAPPLPLVHVHCFTKSDQPEADLLGRISGVIDHPITVETPETVVHFVRKVAPNKDMYCVTFRLPREVAFTSTLKRKAESD